MNKRKTESKSRTQSSKKTRVSQSAKDDATYNVRSSRSKALKLIQQQAAGSDSSSYDEECSSDEFIEPSQPSSSGIIVQPSNSFLSDSSSSDDEPSSSKSRKQPRKKSKIARGSDSSGSSSEYYEESKIHRASIRKIKILQKSETSSVDAVDFNSVESKILQGITRLSDSEESDVDDAKETSNCFVPTHVLFPQILNQFTNDVTVCSLSIKKEGKSLETTNKHELDISQLLALGESQSCASNGTTTAQTPVKIEKKPQRKKRQKKEKVVTEKNKTSKTDEYQKKIIKTKMDSEEGSDWEEVQHKVEHEIPKEGVEIRVELPDIVKKKKKKVVDVEAIIKRRINLIKRENQVVSHKVSVLCWLGHGMHVNSILNSPSLMGLALSIIPSQQHYPPRQADLNYLESITRWFQRNIKILNDEEPVDKSLAEILEQCFHTKQAFNKRLLVLAYISMMRSLGLKTRLVINLQPLPLKPNSDELFSLSQNNSLKPQPSSSKNVPDKTNVKSKSQISPGKNKTLKSINEKKLKVTSTKSNSNKLQEKGSKQIESKLNKLPNSPERNQKQSVTKDISTSVQAERKKRSDTKVTSNTSEKVSKKRHTSRDTSTSQEKSKKPQNHASTSKEKNKIESAKQSSSNIPQNKTKFFGNNSSVKSKITLKMDTKLSNNIKEKVQTRSRKGKSPIASTSKGSKKGKVEIKRSGEKFVETDDTRETMSTESRSLRQRRSSKYKDESDSSDDSKWTSKSRKKSIMNTSKNKNHKSDDSDFEPQVIAVCKSQSSVIDRRVLSSPDDDVPATKTKKVKTGVDVWAEVFVEMEEKWICVDVPNGKVHCVTELYSNASSPVIYVVAFGSDMSVRDVSKRYCHQFHTVTRKLRVDIDWWDGAIKPFYGSRSAYDREEEADMDKQMQDRPLPTSISEYKNHPLYALKRHLLKFEAIYPPEALPLGYIRGEPVYSRDCVFTLRSRETWMKEAKIVKTKEEPYKIVKSRPKYDRMSGLMVTDKPLDIFGPWQVEDYVPPPAVDGKVPRNEYGNVELFKPTMLPKGTVHLSIPGLNRIAKKLNVDCAPAMMGFDFHCGACHPVFDGFVVCEEFKDLLLDAHRQEEEERERRQEEKRQKRVYGNWRRLINGLLIRENLKKKYNFDSKKQEGDGASSNSKETSKKIQKKQVQRKKRKTTSSESD